MSDMEIEYEIVTMLAEQRWKLQQQLAEIDDQLKKHCTPSMLRMMGWLRSGWVCSDEVVSVITGRAGRESLCALVLVAAFGMKSRREGDAAVQSYRRGQQALRKGGSDVDIEGRIKRIEQALDHLLDGLVKQRSRLAQGSR